MLGEGLSWLIVCYLVHAAGEILRARCAWNLLWDPNEIWHSHESPYLSTWHQLVTAVLALPQGHPPVVFTPVSLLLMGRLNSYIDNNSTQHPLQVWTILSVRMENLFSATHVTRWHPVLTLTCFLIDQHHLLRWAIFLGRYILDGCETECRTHSLRPATCLLRIHQIFYSEHWISAEQTWKCTSDTHLSHLVSNISTNQVRINLI